MRSSRTEDVERIADRHTNSERVAAAVARAHEAGGGGLDGRSGAQSHDLALSHRRARRRWRDCMWFYAYRAFFVGHDALLAFMFSSFALLCARVAWDAFGDWNSLMRWLNGAPGFTRAENPTEKVKIAWMTFIVAMLLGAFVAFDM